MATTPLRWQSWGWDAAYAGREGYIVGERNPPLSHPELMSFPPDIDIVSIATNGSCGAGLTSTGDIWVWGYAENDGWDNTGAGRGCFGDQFPGTGESNSDNRYGTAIVNPPAQMTYPEASGVMQVEMTRVATFWLRIDGTVWGVGWNGNGEFGIGEDPTDNAIYHGTPIQLTGLPPNIKKIRAWPWGYGLFAIDSQNQLWFAGYDGMAFNGTGISPPGNTYPWGWQMRHIVVQGVPDNIVDIQVGFRQGTAGTAYGNTAHALLSDGTVMWWGRSMIDGGAVTETLWTPRLYPGVSGITQMYSTGVMYFLNAAGDVSGIGWDYGGALCNGTWATDPYGALGDYTQNDHYALPPLRIDLPDGRKVVQLTKGNMGAYAMMVLTDDQQIWGWGLNDNLWGSSDPTFGAEGPAGPGDIARLTAVSPPYPVFQGIFNPANPPSDLVLMDENAVLVLAPYIVAPLRPVLDFADTLTKLYLVMIDSSAWMFGGGLRTQLAADRDGRQMALGMVAVATAGEAAFFCDWKGQLWATGTVYAQNDATGEWTLQDIVGYVIQVPIKAEAITLMGPHGIGPSYMTPAALWVNRDRNLIGLGQSDNAELETGLLPSYPNPITQPTGGGYSWAAPDDASAVVATQPPFDYRQYIWRALATSNVAGYAYFGAKIGGPIRPQGHMIG